MSALRSKVLELTGTFETSSKPPTCYSVSTGNFDGAGISYGAIQFNLKSGTLQPILISLLQSSPKLMENIFGSYLNELVTVLKLSKQEQINWADSISDKSKKKRALIKPWKQMFWTLGQTRECQNLQSQGIDGYYKRALINFERWDLWSEVAVALLFDISVQNGSMQPKGTNIISRINEQIKKLPTNLDEIEYEKQKLEIIARTRASISSSKWRNDVLSRKMCIINRSGVVHGIKINLDDYDIHYVKAEV